MAQLSNAEGGIVLKVIAAESPKYQLFHSPCDRKYSGDRKQMNIYIHLRSINFLPPLFLGIKNFGGLPMYNCSLGYYIVKEKVKPP
jgi:hypothetical protein